MGVDVFIMRLIEPMDYIILKTLIDREICDYSTPVRVMFLANNAIERGETLRDDPLKQGYVQSRMGVLRRDKDVLKRVPPHNSGLYQAGELGYAALRRYEETGETWHDTRELIRYADEMDEGPKQPQTPD